MSEELPVKDLADAVVDKFDGKVPFVGDAVDAYAIVEATLEELQTKGFLKIVEREEST